jgi:predicted RNA-binding Zn-ribbon protein involved in translation (DUF1610 family)
MASNHNDTHKRKRKTLEFRCPTCGDIPLFACTSCGKEPHFIVCPVCGAGQLSPTYSPLSPSNSSGDESIKTIALEDLEPNNGAQQPMLAAASADQVMAAPLQQQRDQPAALLQQQPPANHNDTHKRERKTHEFRCPNFIDKSAQQPIPAAASAGQVMAAPLQHQQMNQPLALFQQPPANQTDDVSLFEKTARIKKELSLNIPDGNAAEIIYEATRQVQLPQVQRRVTTTEPVFTLHQRADFILDKIGAHAPQQDQRERQTLFMKAQLISNQLSLQLRGSVCDIIHDGMNKVGPPFNKQDILNWHQHADTVLRIIGSHAPREHQE